MTRDTEADSTVAAATSVGAAAEWQSGLADAIDRANGALHATVASKGSLGLGQLQGFVAERWHAGTFNVDAYKKGLWNLAASAPDSTLRASPDIVVTKGGVPIYESQSKYYATGAKTAAQLRNPDYTAMDSKIVPADQLDAVVDASRARIPREAVNRPPVAEALDHTVETATDRVSVGGAESSPLGRAESDDLTKRLRAGEDPILARDSLSAQEIAGKALMGGAVAGGIGFAVGAAPRLIEAIGAWRSGQGLSDPEFRELLADAGRAGAKAGLWASLQGAVGTSLVHLAGTGQLGSLVGELGPGPIGALSVVVVQSLRDGLAWHRGEIDGVVFAQRTTAAAITAASGVAGAAIGQALIPVPVLGAMVGSLVGSLIGRFGSQVLFWAVERLVPLVRDALHGVGNVLFGLDLIADARRQTDAFAAQLQVLDDRLFQVRNTEFRIRDSFRLTAAELEAIDARGAELDAELAGLEAGAVSAGSGDKSDRL